MYIISVKKQGKSEKVVYVFESIEEATSMYIETLTKDKHIKDIITLYRSSLLDDDTEDIDLLAQAQEKSSVFNLDLLEVEDKDVQHIKKECYKHSYEYRMKKKLKILPLAIILGVFSIVLAPLFWILSFLLIFIKNFWAKM